jgi:hypothetical protein
VQTAVLTEQNKAPCLVLEEKSLIYLQGIKSQSKQIAVAVALYSGSAQFKSQEGHWLF